MKALRRLAQLAARRAMRPLISPSLREHFRGPYLAETSPHSPLSPFPLPPPSLCARTRLPSFRPPSVRPSKVPALSQRALSEANRWMDGTARES